MNELTAKQLRSALIASVDGILGPPPQSVVSVRATMGTLAEIMAYIALQHDHIKPTPELIDAMAASTVSHLMNRVAGLKVESN